jgi:hypothetical protein
MAIKRRDRSLQFALNYHVNTRGEKLEFQNFFYLLDVFSDPSPETVIQSAVQTGKSELCVCKHFADLSLGLSVFYVQPKRESRDIFVQNRIDKLIARLEKDHEHPYTKLSMESVGHSDSVYLKHLGSGTVRYGASQSVTDFKEFPADVLYIDEFDDCEAEGLSMAEDRLQASPYKFKYIIGNPKLPAMEHRVNLCGLFQDSDAKRLHYECPECGEVCWLDWFKHVVKPVVREGVIVNYDLLDDEWNPGLERDLMARCFNCGHWLDRETCCVGWIPTGDPNHRVSGWQLSGMAPLSKDLSELYHKFVKAIPNITAMKTFVNSDLGEGFSGGVGNQVTEGLLAKCVEQYEMPTWSRGPCTMGIDVGSFFDVRISDYVPEEDEHGRIQYRRRRIYVGKVYEKKEIFRLMRTYRVSVAVIDAFPESRLAKDIQAEAPAKVWRCQYLPTEGSNTRAIRWADGGDQAGEPMVFIDRTEAMDTIYGEYVHKRIIEAPDFATVLKGAYFAEMTNPVRTREEESGKFIWAKCVDHQFHANVYDWLAGQDPSVGFSRGSSDLLRGRKTDNNRQFNDDYGAIKAMQKLARGKGVLHGRAYRRP